MIECKIMKNLTLAITVFFFLTLFAVFCLRGLPYKESFREPVDQEEVVESTPELKPIVKTLHFGDVMLDRGVKSTIARGADPFEFVSEFIHTGNYDLVTANLEGPFASPMECQDKPYSFRFEPEYISFLQNAKISDVSLANNHSLDCYQTGLSETKDILNTAKIGSFGGFSYDLAEILYKDIGGVSVALLGFDDTMRALDLERVHSLVLEARSRSDLVIVNIHWGEEYFDEPTKRQREVATFLAENGVDAIIGHHPHVVEGAEWIGRMPVFYSLGNFVFDQLTLETQTGYAVELSFDLNEQSVTGRIHPYRIIRNQPTFLEGEVAGGICEKVLGSRSEKNDQCSFSISL